MKLVVKSSAECVKVDMESIPKYQSDAMCRTLIGCITKLFEDPAVRADYERWKQARYASTDHGLADARTE